MIQSKVDDVVYAYVVPLTSCCLCRERANLSLQLKDTKTVVGRLQWVIGLILHIIAFFIYLTIFDVSALAVLCKVACRECTSKEYHM